MTFTIAGKGLPSPAEILPPDARASLRRASCVQPTEQDPNARIKAIDAATAKVRAQHPQFFKE